MRKIQRLEQNVNKKKLKKLQKKIVIYQALSNKKSIKKTANNAIKSSTYSRTRLTYETSGAIISSLNNTELTT